MAMHRHKHMTQVQMDASTVIDSTVLRVLFRNIASCLRSTGLDMIRFYMTSFYWPEMQILLYTCIFVMPSLALQLVPYSICSCRWNFFDISGPLRQLF